LNPYSKEY